LSKVPIEFLRAQADEVRRRIADYDASDVIREREELVQRWRQAHPLAAAETSAPFHEMLPLYVRKPTGKEKPAIACHPHEEWHNDVYHATVRRYQDDPVFGTDGGLIQIGISSLDGTARHDWRDFQAIKNQIAGPECEAFELYPAESRVLDPSNYYTLWCFPGLRRLKIGVAYREVLDVDDAIAPQRAFAREELNVTTEAATSPPAEPCG